MVIIGNPPYNVGQRDGNDDNRNRPYKVVDDRIRETYAKSSSATLNTKVYDAYCKFFRWATDRLKGRPGVVCFVSNNAFVRSMAFDGFRKHLTEDFGTVYHFDIGGNARSGGGGNVFGIKVGVGITLAVSGGASQGLLYYAVPDSLRGDEKLGIMGRLGSLASVSWDSLRPDDRHSWLNDGLRDEYEAFLPVSTKMTKAAGLRDPHTIFRTFSLGVGTNRDEWVYDYDAHRLASKIRQFAKNYNSEVHRYRAEEPPPDDVDGFVNRDPGFLKWTDRLKSSLLDTKLIAFDEKSLRHSQYRPFCRRLLYFDNLLNQRRYQQHRIFPSVDSENENRALVVGGYDRKEMSVLASQRIPDLNFFSDPAQCFPFYTYTPDGGNRQENITDWAVSKFREKYGKDVTKWDIFYYVYSLLHNPLYRERYAENLKRELPRIPLTVAPKDFPTYVDIGRKMADLHLNYETVEEYPLKWIENKDIPFSWRVEKMRLNKDRDSLVVNNSLTLGGIPAECFDYRLGNRSALEWVVDQYRVTTDKRSGIVSDPNRADDQEYIIRLVGRVVTVSVETVKLVGSLPDLGLPGD